MIERRKFLVGLATLVASPILAPLLAKLPMPVAKRVGAWATAHIEAGAITSITIISAGSGYTSPPIWQIQPIHEIEGRIDRNDSPP